MERKTLVAFTLLVLFLIVFVVIFFTSSSREKIKKKDRDIQVGDSMAISEDLETESVTLYFLAENESFLYPEEREILADPDITSRARQVIQELLMGSQNGLVSPFPPEAKLRELYVTDEGIAYVDFTREMQDNHLFGSSADMATVYSIVNSLTLNFESIKKVFILIDGSEKETLGGHVDLSRPFIPRKDLIAR